MTEENVIDDPNYLDIKELEKLYDITNIFNVDDNQMYKKTNFKGIYNSDIITAIKTETEDTGAQLKLKFKMSLICEFHSNLAYSYNGRTILSGRREEIDQSYKTNGICVNLNPKKNKVYNTHKIFKNQILNYDWNLINAIKNMIFTEETFYDIRKKIDEKDYNYLIENKTFKVQKVVMGSRLAEAMFTDSVRLVDSDMDIAISITNTKINANTKNKLVNHFVENFVNKHSDYSYEMVKGREETVNHRFRIKNNVTGKVVELFIIYNTPYHTVKNFHLSWIRMWYDLNTGSFNMTPSCYYSYITGISHMNNNISAGGKKIEIIYKYASRGFNIYLGPEDKKLFDEYVKSKGVLQESVLKDTNNIIPIIYNEPYLLLEVMKLIEKYQKKNPDPAKIKSEVKEVVNYLNNIKEHKKEVEIEIKKTNKKHIQDWELL